MQILKIVLAKYNLFLYNIFMGKITLKIITSIAVLAWMIFVFQFSNQPSDKSQNTSGNFARIVVNLISKTTEISEMEKEELVQKINPIIRKIAHYLLYTIGGIFIIINVKQYKDLSNKSQIIVGLIIGMLYAISDEIHQYFIPGRACQVKDVCIDSLGIITGIFCVLTIIKLYHILSTRNRGEYK